MFTGVIEEVGRIEGLKRTDRGCELQIKCSKIYKEINSGDSLAVNGICFTILEVNASLLKVMASAETLDKTTVSYWSSGYYVNLERALRLDGRLDGHLVLGHIDFVGQINSIRKLGQSKIIRIKYPTEMDDYFVLKGSVAVDGISLTISSLGSSYFENTIIPFTWENTNFRSLNINSKVNVEVDIIGKYVVSFLKKRNTLEKSRITEEYLKYQGFKSS